MKSNCLASAIFIDNLTAFAHCRWANAMTTMRLAGGALGVALVVFGPSCARADLVTYTATGESGFPSSNVYLGGQFTAGQPFTYTFTLNTAIPNSASADPSQGVYTNALVSSSGSVGNYQFSTGPGDVQINMVSAAGPGTFFAYAQPVTGAAVNGARLNYVTIQLEEGPSRTAAIPVLTPLSQFTGHTKFDLIFTIPAATINLEEISGVWALTMVSNSATGATNSTTAPAPPGHGGLNHSTGHNHSTGLNHRTGLNHGTSLNHSTGHNHGTGGLNHGTSLNHSTPNHSTGFNHGAGGLNPSTGLKQSTGHNHSTVHNHGTGRTTTAPDLGGLNHSTGASTTAPATTTEPDAQPRHRSSAASTTALASTTSPTTSDTAPAPRHRTSAASNPPNHSTGGLNHGAGHTTTAPELDDLNHSTGLNHGTDDLNPSTGDNHGTSGHNHSTGGLNHGHGSLNHSTGHNHSTGCFRRSRLGNHHSSFNACGGASH